MSKRNTERSNKEAITKNEESTTDDSHEEGANIYHPDFLQGDQTLVIGIAGNALWQEWQIGLPLPTFSYDYDRKIGGFEWQLPERLAPHMKSITKGRREFSLLHEFLNGTGLIADYKYSPRTHQVAMKFWIVSRQHKEGIQKRHHLFHPEYASTTPSAEVEG